jgi:hypothetical protein
MKPVAAKATFWETLNFSAGREKSLSPAATKPHLASGAQKKIVLNVSAHFLRVQSPEDILGSGGVIKE